MSDNPNVNDAPRSHLHSKFFWVGLSLLVLGLGLLAYSFFFLDCLTNPQALALKFILPLLGGFIAWTFRGNAELSVQGIFTAGSVLSLGGGYVVFYLLLQFLFSDPQIKLVCPDGPNAALMRVSQELANTTHSFEKVGDQPNEKAKVRVAAQAVLSGLSAIKDDGLKWREITVKYLYSAKAKLLLALVADKDADALIEGARYARSAEEHADYGLTLIDHFRADPSVSEDARAAYLSEISSDQIDEQLKYIKLLALAYLVAAGIPDAQPRLTTVLDDINIGYLRDQAADREEVVKWFCIQYPDASKLCKT